MRELMVSAFNDFVVGTTQVFTPQGLNGSLGIWDLLGIQAVVDQVTNATSLTVSVEHSNDQRNWSRKSATPEINASAIDNTQTWNFVVFDSASAPTLGFVRLNISVAGTNPQAHLRIFVVGRDAA